MSTRTLKFARDALLEFGQRQIGRLMDPAAQSLVMLFQAGAPVAAALPGLDAAGGRLEFTVTLDTALGDVGDSGVLRRALPALSGRDDAFAQIEIGRAHV